MATNDSTPLMKQYNSFKAKYPDAILLFRVGDFYETFGDDAVKTSSILGITLTSRNNGYASEMALAGFPYHALDTYLPKLVRAGQRVAICDQLEDPKLAKTIVKRGVTELITPGIVTHENALTNKENHFLASVYFEKKLFGIALLDISTGEFLATEGDQEQIDKLLQSFQPKEILYERSQHEQIHAWLSQQYYLYKLDDWYYTLDTCKERLIRHFEVDSLKGFGIGDFSVGIAACGAILQYLDTTQHDKLKHITSIARLYHEEYVWIDKFTLRNLELLYSTNENAKTLIDIIDRTQTPMGSRMLKRWVAFPLKDIAQINTRLQLVEFFTKSYDFVQELINNLRHIGDLERLISKVSIAKAGPRDVVQINNALFAIKKIKNLFPQQSPVSVLAGQLNECQTLSDKIASLINPDCPVVINKGNTINSNVDAELDELRNILYHSKEYLNDLQNRESIRTGIPSLKISFNNVFGYYIEVRNTHKDKVPPEWIRKQTLVNAERYITQELKEYEDKILGAEEKILAIETRIFQELLAEILTYIPTLQLNASIISKLDCFQSLATIASENNYSKPEINESFVIDISEGRHPVIEKQLPADKPFIPNDIYLDSDNQQIIVITGPNMSGKSALLRQTAIIVLLAQMGSFVPAKRAKIGLVDKIFTRVGASDNISQGESTFMVEMIETATILNNLSARSLILLDEIGRGTSTYDGISIAWAIAEYIHEYAQGKPRTLFATHYHELNEMEKSFNRIKNFHVSVKEVNNRVLFLRKLVPGGTEHSFGIHVAEMAGMPKSVVHRSKDILKQLEQSNSSNDISKPISTIAPEREGYQLSIFQLDDPVLKQIRDQIKNLDINNLTPIEALNKLNEIKKITGL
ncbi:MAG TPA: DNA mismatch repair protein MutS [Bacteroidales bacterium]|jgi:DNA mismatch repair protein MutS|nr:DNA mismatch repair protein MutS [Bacteroidales bacterium]